MRARPHVQDMLFPLIHSHHLNTLSICQHMGSPMKMILRSLFKISQIRSIIADIHRWEAFELCITPRCFVSCCVSQPLCITHPLCIVYPLYIVSVYGTQLYITPSHLSCSTPGCAQDGYGADMRRSREQTSSAYSILITLVAVDLSVILGLLICLINDYYEPLLALLKIKALLSSPPLPLTL